MLSNTQLPHSRRMPVRATILRIWIDELTAKLREAEARAARPGATPPEIAAARASAQHFAGQIQTFQDELFQLDQVVNA